MKLWLRGAISWSELQSRTNQQRTLDARISVRAVLQDHQIWQAGGILAKGRLQMPRKDRHIDELLGAVKGHDQEVQYRRRLHGLFWLLDQHD